MALCYQPVTKMNDRLTQKQDEILDHINTRLSEVLLACCLEHGKLAVYLSLTEMFVRTSAAMQIPKEELLENLKTMLDAAYMVESAMKNHSLENDPDVN